VRICLHELEGGRRDGQVSLAVLLQAHFRRDARKNPIVQEYVLPDFSPNSTSRVGYIRSGPNAAPPVVEGEVAPKKKPVEGEEEQVLYMGNERFAGPELLFNPSDIGQSPSP